MGIWHNVRNRKTPGENENSFAQRRHKMVQQQLEQRGIHDPRVLAAMEKVPREQFVAREQRDAAYADSALPIGHGQTISQPFTVAFMCQALRLAGHERVLEIGTGSGYSSAVLAHLALHVYSLERLEPLAEDARKRLARLGQSNVSVIVNDGTLGLPEDAPFDAIVAAAGGTSLPQPYRDQIVEGGRIVVPLENRSGGQTMWRFTRAASGWQAEDLGRFSFVPLVGELGWQEPT